MVTIKIIVLKEFKGMTIKEMEIERGSNIILPLILMNPRGGLSKEILMKNTHFILLLQVPLQVMMKYG